MGCVHLLSGFDSIGLKEQDHCLTVWRMDSRRDPGVGRGGSFRATGSLCPGPLPSSWGFAGDLPHPWLVEASTDP